MKTFILFSVLFVFANVSFAQHLWINDPQSWRGGTGTIEETKITYQPQGLFMQVDWELTFSARNIPEFSEKDTVEVVYNFKLPEEAIVNDSCLWFGMLPMLQEVVFLAAPIFLFVKLMRARYPKN